MEFMSYSLAETKKIAYDFAKSVSLEDAHQGNGKIKKAIRRLRIAFGIRS